MSTLTLSASAAAAAGCVYLPFFNDAGSIDGRTIRQIVYADLVAAGTDYSLKVYPNGTFLVSVDGGAYTTFQTDDGSHTWNDVVVFTGLTDAPHTVSVRGLLYMDRAAAMTVTGSAPAISTPAGFSSDMHMLTDPLPSCISMDGSNSAYVSNIGGFVPAWSGFTVRFKATITGFKFFTYNQANSYTLWIDGVAQTSHDAPNLARSEYVTFSGLDGGAEHEYLISGLIYNTAIVTDTPGGLNTAALTAHKAAIGYGDSITQGVGATKLVLAWTPVAAASRQKGYFNLGVSGSTTHDPGGPSPGESVARTGEVTAKAALVDRVVILYGHNDLSYIPVTFSFAQFQTSYETMLAAIVAGMDSGTRIYCLGVLPYTGAGSELASINARIAAAVVNVGNADTHYVDTTGWIDPAIDTGDGAHPNDGGYLKVAQQVAPLLAAASITTTETTLERGQAGQTIHVQIDGGTSTSTADWTVAVGGSNGSITAINATDPANPILTVTAPQTAGTATLRLTTESAACTLTNQDTVAPSSPTGVSAGTPTAYSVPLAFTLPAASPAGETITATVKKNGSVITSGISSSPYTFAGVADGDTLSIRSDDNAGNHSAYVDVTFDVPSNADIAAAVWVYGNRTLTG